MTYTMLRPRKHAKLNLSDTTYWDFGFKLGLSGVECGAAKTHRNFQISAGLNQQLYYGCVPSTSRTVPCTTSDTPDQRSVGTLVSILTTRMYVRDLDFT